MHQDLCKDQSHGRTESNHELAQEDDQAVMIKAAMNGLIKWA